jgi:protein-disulfide isomerase/uncharacterized membrane protein
MAIKRAWKLTIPLFLLSVFGTAISFLLMQKHVLKEQGPGWFARVCGEETPSPEASDATTQPSALTSQPTTARAAAERPRRKAPTPATAPASAPASQPTKKTTAAGPLPGANCASVLASRWATIPPAPRPDEAPAEEIAGQPAPRGVPSAFLGIVYFSSLAIWFLFVGRPTPDRREWYRIPLVFIIGGVLWSLFFIFIMFTQTEEWCPWCLACHIANFLIFGGMLLLRPEHVRAESEPLPMPSPTAEAGPVQIASVGEPTVQTADAAAAVVVPAVMRAPVPTAAVLRVSHPPLRLVGACILLAAATGGMVWNIFAVRVGLEREKQVKQQLDEFRGNRSFLATIYEQSPKVKIPLRPDDPQTAKTDFDCSIVVFSDLQCPWCRTFSLMLEKRIQQYFGGHLRITWKHFPLCTDCNNGISRTVHPEACKAALAAEAARLQGGNDAFWKAHDRLFAAQKSIKDFDYRALAVELGLDADRFLTDMRSEAAGARIAEDVALAKSLDVKGTPAIFLDGRRVEPKLVTLLPFWEEMGMRFIALRDQKIRAREDKARQAAATQPAAGQPTPSTQDQ